jgi:hypothetical protein
MKDDTLVTFCLCPGERQHDSNILVRRLVAVPVEEKKEAPQTNSLLERALRCSKNARRLLAHVRQAPGSAKTKRKGDPHFPFPQNQKYEYILMSARSIHHLRPSSPHTKRRCHRPETPTHALYNPKPAEERDRVQMCQNASWRRQHWIFLTSDIVPTQLDTSAPAHTIVNLPIRGLNSEPLKT